MTTNGFKDFYEVEFQEFYQPGYVYVLFWSDGSREIPFYVGETSQIWSRMNDYYWADFDAPTDFRVGEAIRYLHSKGLAVKVRYHRSEDRHADEAGLIAQLRTQAPLLNGERAYDYKKANEANERTRIREWVDCALRVSNL
jgi:hypothetical protein